jgi:hypothetical protein
MHRLRRVVIQTYHISIVCFALKTNSEHAILKCEQEVLHAAAASVVRFATFRCGPPLEGGPFVIPGAVCRGLTKRIFKRVLW